jgi:predicted helicase
VSIQNYIEKISQRYKSGIATEHTYRGDLQNLLESLLPDIAITNEPRRIKCGAPDLILTRKNNSFDIGWIEAKNIGKNLDSKEYQEQFDRYKSALHNLIITDYLRFDFHTPNREIVSINIAYLEGKKIRALPESFDHFTNLIKDFANYVGESITSASQLAKIMAAKARLLANVIQNALNIDNENESEASSSLKEQLKDFKKVLLHDIKPSEFADIYAQTIAYGMFTACLHDKTPKEFSRRRSAENIPLSNPFLRKFFDHIAGINLDEIDNTLPLDDRIIWIVDALAGIFRLVDTEKLMKNFDNNTQQSDPVIHFYETFLAEYNPKLRKSRGVWYTPHQVVNFIVRAVDDILKTEFNIKDGLVNADSPNDSHKVQILDPATGTGTFLAEIVKYIYQTKFQSMQGAWSAYVEQNLIPRLNGFEVLMASYAIAHLKLDLLFTKTNYQPKKQQRFNIYLTNSLEEHQEKIQSLFTMALSKEANEANVIKRDSPIMVVIGNPPYAVSSSNKNPHKSKKNEKQPFDWIENLLQDYKKDLNEKNIQPLSDDYIKFIRYGSHFIEKNHTGILAYISNNSFIDGLIHRQMRKHLLETFDSIYILDLHGSNKKKETALDGSKDENVFDIMQGVSINLFIKTGKKQPQALAELYHFDLYGLREEKYQTLLDNNLKSLSWTKIDCRAPEYFFIAKDIKVQKEYSKGFSINTLFAINSSGIKTHRDDFVIDLKKEDLETRIKKFYNLSFSETEFKTKFNLKDNRDWSLSEARTKEKFKPELIREILYRPFDYRNIYYSSNLIDFDRRKVMQHLVKGDNVSLISCRQQSTFDFQHVFISRLISDMCCVSSQTKETGYIFPLYLYSETENQHSTKETSHRIPNLDNTLIKKIARKLGLKFTAEKETKPNTFAPIDLLDYIYAVLHSPTYRETYKEFLKIDFPRVPYPELENFWQLVELGGDLRQLHLLESPKLDQPITRYPMNGLNCITRKVNKNTFELTDSENQLGQIWINDSQYFDQVPLVAWNFYVGGYQPVQKWLKDRQGRVLSFDDILHYQKVIKALTETDRIMKEIDLIMARLAL